MWRIIAFWNRGKIIDINIKFLTRVERLYKDNQQLSFEEVYESLKLRDKLDLKGKNFIKPENAIEIDTTNKTLDEVFSLMQEYINEYLNRQNRLFI